MTLGQVVKDFPLPCQVEVFNNLETGFCSIVNVVPASAKWHQTKIKISASIIADYVCGNDVGGDDAAPLRPAAGARRPPVAEVDDADDLPF